MKTDNIKIVELNKENWYECCELEVSEKQMKYMVPNAVSIAQSKFETSLKPYAIYTGDKVVGFLMFNTLTEELDGHWIYRIMVDKNFQGQGIGRAATKLMIAEMARTLDPKKIVVGYPPNNLAAHKLYASLGFKNNGNRFGKEMAVIKQLIE